MRCFLIALAISASGCSPSTDRPAEVLQSQPWLQSCGNRQIHTMDVDIIPPVARHRAKPDYPAPSADAREGVIIVEAVIDEGGSVCASRLVRGLSPEVDAAAVAAARRWKFDPAIRSGRPVAVSYYLAIEYLSPRMQ